MDDVNLCWGSDGPELTAELDLAVEEYAVMIWEDPELLVKALIGLELTERHIQVIQAVVGHARRRAPERRTQSDLAAICLYDVFNSDVEDHARGDL